MRFQSSGSGNNNSTVRCQTTVSSLDVKELFSTHVGTKTSLSEHKAVLSYKLQSNLVSNNGTVSMGYVGKRTSMDKDRLSFKSLI